MNSTPIHLGASAEPRATSAPLYIAPLLHFELANGENHLVRDIPLQARQSHQFPASLGKRRTGDESRSRARAIDSRTYVSRFPERYRECHRAKQELKGDI